MKIKFLKPFRLYNPIGDDMMMGEGAVENMKEDYAEWLIDNGFAEEVKSGGWKPEIDDTYYCVLYNRSMFTCDIVGRQPWLNDELDEYRYSIGNCFKTSKAAERYCDYLKAVATVSHDEGFMRKSDGGFGWPVIEFTTNNPGVDDIAERQHAGEFYFDTREHALNSAMNHTREWQTILNYDWSRE